MDGQQPYRKPDLMEIIDKYLKEKEIDKSQKYDQYSYKSSDEISRSTEKLKEWLEKTDKNLKYNKQPDESSEKIFELMEKIYKWELKYRIRDHVKDIKELFNEIHEYVKEFADISEIKESNTVIDFDYEKIGNELIYRENDIKMCLYNEDDGFMCLLDTQISPDHIECTHYDDKRFIYARKINSLMRSIEEKIIDIYKILYPEVPKYHINTDISMYSDKPKKEIPELSIKGNSAIYDEGIFHMKITLQ